MTDKNNSELESSFLPPIAIICRCRDFNFLFNGAASGSGATSQSSVKDLGFLETPLSYCRRDAGSSSIGLLEDIPTIAVPNKWDWGAWEHERIMNDTLCHGEDGKFHPFLLNFPQIPRGSSSIKSGSSAASHSLVVDVVMSPPTNVSEDRANIWSIPPVSTREQESTDIKASYIGVSFNLSHTKRSNAQ